MLSLSTLFVASRPLLAAIGDVEIAAVIAGDLGSVLLSSGDVVSLQSGWVPLSDTTPATLTVFLTPLLHDFLVYYFINMVSTRLLDVLLFSSDAGHSACMMG